MRTCPPKAIANPHLRGAFGGIDGRVAGGVEVHLAQQEHEKRERSAGSTQEGGHDPDAGGPPQPEVGLKELHTREGPR
jgi:hypothetical protein